MPLNKSGRITLGQIYNEFLPQTNTAKHSISEYYRTGANVPDIFENKNIPIHEPTAALRGRVNWSDYYGTSAVVRPYTTALPAIDEDDFWRHCEGSPNYWTAVQDNWKQYVTRKDGAYCVMLEVRTPYARINVQPAQTRLGTELGEDSGYEKLLRNTNLNTDYFPFGEWTMTIPRKITRFRIIATAGGGSGSVQKITASDSALKGPLTPIIEEGHDGGDVTITANDLTVRLLGGLGGGKSIRLSGNDKNYDPNRVQVTGSAAVSTNKLFKYADSPQTRTVYGITNAATAGESAAFLPVTFPARHKKQSTGANEMDWFAGSEYPINLVWWEDSPENSLYGQANGSAGGSGRGGSSIWSDGYPAAAEHPNQGEPTEPNSTDWGTGGAAGQHAQRGAVTYGGDAAETAYLGDFETAPGEEITIKVPEGGVQSINLYTDYNQTDKDNFTPSLADRDQYANHPVYGTEFYVGSSYVSKSGKGGDGFVQIFGATGRAYSEMSHAGTVLLDEDYNIIHQKFSSTTSLKGVDNYNPSYTLPYTVDVIGTEDPTVPKIFYIAYTGRIRKNGLMESKTQFVSDGCSVSVSPVTEDLASIAPSSAVGSILNLESWLATATFGTPYPASNLRKKLYCVPEFSSDEPIVSGNRGSNAADDFENVGNTFADSCMITFDVENYSPPYPKMVFKKSTGSTMGIGPTQVSFEKNGTVEYIPEGSSTAIVGNTIAIGVGEEYQCSGPGGMIVDPPANTAASYPKSPKTNYLLTSTSYVPWTLAKAKNAMGETVTEYDNEVTFDYKMIGGGHGGTGKGYSGGGSAPDTSVEVSYDIVGGGYGGWGRSQSAGEETDPTGGGTISNPITFKGDTNGTWPSNFNFWKIGGGRIKDLFPELVDEDGYVNICDDWMLGAGLKHGGYAVTPFIRQSDGDLYGYNGYTGACRYNRVTERFPELFELGQYSTYDLEDNSSQDQQSCETYHPKADWKEIALGLERLQGRTILESNKLGQQGNNGTATVLTNRTNQNQIANTDFARTTVNITPDIFNPTKTSTTNIVARPQNWNGHNYGNGGASFGFLRKESIGVPPLVFRNMFNAGVGNSAQYPTYNFYWEIGGGRISELFPDLVDADGYVRITEDWQLYSFKGFGPSSKCHHNRPITKFPEFFGETTVNWQSDDSNQDGGTEDHSCKVWILLSNWKDIAQRSERLQGGVIYDTPYYFPPGSTPLGINGTGEDVGANGLIVTGNVTMQVGDVIDIQIGVGGTGGAQPYPSTGRAPDGKAGAVMIQGVLYTTSGSHTVFSENTVEVDFDIISGGQGGQGQGFHTGDIGEGMGADPFMGHFGDIGAHGTASSITNIGTSALIEDTGTSTAGVAPTSAAGRVKWNGQDQVYDPNRSFGELMRGYGEGGQNRQFGVSRYYSESQLTYSAKSGVQKSGTINLPVGTQIQVVVGTGGRGGNANNTGANIPIDYGHPGGEGEGPAVYDWQLPSYAQSVQADGENYPFHDVGGTFSKALNTAGQPTYSGGSSKIEKEWQYIWPAVIGPAQRERSVGRGEDGTDGAVMIQGVLYTENSTHTVTAGIPAFHFEPAAGSAGGSTVLGKAGPLQTTLLEIITWSAGDATVTSSPIVYSDYTTLIITYIGVASNASVTTFEMRKPTGHITPRNYNSGEGELPMNGTQTITTSSGASSSVINLNGTEVTTAHLNTIGNDYDPITFGWTAGGFAAGGSIVIRGTSANIVNADVNTFTGLTMTQTIVADNTIALTPILAAHAFNAGQSPRGWEGGVQGNGGKNSEYSAPIDGVIESLNNGYAQNGGEASGTITAKIGDVYDFEIGDGGIGSDDADPLSTQKAPDGVRGSILIQGIRYDTSGSHVVTGTPTPIDPGEDVARLIEITSSGGKWWVDGRVTWFSCSVETPADGESLGTGYNRPEPAPPVIVVPTTTQPATTSYGHGGDDNKQWGYGVDQFGNVSSGYTNDNNGWISGGAQSYSGAKEFSTGLKDGGLNVDNSSNNSSSSGGGGWSDFKDAVSDFFSSDIRLKTNIEKLDEFEDLHIYTWNYTNGIEGRWKGVMAQDLLNTKYADAVTLYNGYYRVNYSKLPVDCIRIS